MDAIGSQLSAARPQAVGALTRYFRDLDLAEECFQEACLRALRTWPEKGLPREPAAWLIFVGRNVGLDAVRRQRRQQELPDDEAEQIPAVPEEIDWEEAMAATLDEDVYRDDALRLLFLCCHPELPPKHQVALALRLVLGLSVEEIARAFLVAPRTMEQRITRAKKRIAQGTQDEAAFATPTPMERAHRLRAVGTMIYLLFNEGYSASGGDAQLRLPLCQEAIRLARLLLRLFPSQTEVMGLLALCLLQHSRRDARLDDAGDLVLLDQQDRNLWDASAIAEGLVLVEKALRHRKPGPYQVQAAIAAVHARACRADDTDWAEIDRLYAALEQLSPSPVVTLNRAVAVWKTRGAEAALALVDPLSADLDDYFHFHGTRGALLAETGRTVDARQALERARDLARTPAESAHLEARLRELPPQ